ncbi:MAG: NlpC/P60 family protein [Eubacteriales bacterium]|nr:NlpC/P60 family protein [Eubacteriales bacterium]
MYDEQRFGDGQDNYLQGAQKAAEAAQKVGSAAGAAGSTATAAGEATANAAAATVQASAQTGKAAAQIAAGTAAGGPWGAILSAAWSLRHTLFKILIFICLFLLFIIVAVVSLPSIVFNNIFRTDPASVDPNGPTEVVANFDDLSVTVSDCIQNGYDAALARVERIIADGGYDYELSMEALVNNGLISSEYDTCYTLAAYSASMVQRGTTKADLQSKLDAVADQMYAVTYETRETQVAVGGDGKDGESAAPEMQTVQYVACTIHPFDQSVILTAFGVDTSAQYDQFSVTYGEAILNMSNALKMTMYGSVGEGSVPPISDAELKLFLANLDCSGKRKELMRCALSLVGRVPYFWGGKSAPGWNEDWNTPRLVTSAGSSSTGTIRPYGLDCSGFTDWVYQTALGISLYAGTWNQWDATHAISEDELLPGDLGFMAAPGTVPVNHVLLYAGEDSDGTKLWVHCASGTGVVLNSPDYVTQFRRRNDVDLEGEFIPADAAEGANYDG